MRVLRYIFVYRELHCEARLSRQDLVGRHFRLFHPDVDPPSPSSLPFSSAEARDQSSDDTNDEAEGEPERRKPIPLPPGTAPVTRRRRPRQRRLPTPEALDADPASATNQRVSQVAALSAPPFEEAEPCLPTPPPQQFDLAAAAPAAYYDDDSDSLEADYSYQPAYVPYIGTLCDPVQELLPAKSARFDPPDQASVADRLSGAADELLGLDGLLGLSSAAPSPGRAGIATAGGSRNALDNSSAGASLFPDFSQSTSSANSDPLRPITSLHLDSPATQALALTPIHPRSRAEHEAALALSLPIARPRHFAVEALLGDADDWEDVADETGGEVEGKKGDGFDWLLESVTGPPGRREPSLFPGMDHLWAPERGHGSKFFMPAQRFCIAYLWPWEIPPLPKLSRYAAQTYSSLLPVLPILHRPTISQMSIDPPLAFALSVVGAGYFASARSFFEQMTHKKREFSVEALSNIVLHPDERMPATQTLLLYATVGIFDDSQAEREFTASHHPLLIQMFLDNEVPPLDIPEDLDLPISDLERVWRDWIRHETYIRIAFLCYLVDMEVGRNAGESKRLLSHSHAALSTLPLPSSDLLWHAESPEEWRSTYVRLQAQQARYRLPGSPPGLPTFKAVLNALLSSTPPLPNSATAATLSSLSHASPLASTVLFQTLSSLQAQIAVSQRLLRNLSLPAPIALSASEGAGMGTFAGGSMVEAAAKSASESQERIAFGLKVIKLLGGTAACDRWFNGVQVIFH
ncbi:uncharacterized protein JCM10292_004671 [Rhodotorula paludigena]|uniref:uncharacterized protein n=1 Tax=Rhodotorula paludigena TaxID=86838 RepID=UPI00317B5B77